MNYNKRYNLEKGMKWINRRVKQERWCIKNRTEGKSNKLIAQIRLEVYENLLKKFIRKRQVEP